MILYSSNTSPFVRKVRVMIDEVGLSEKIQEKMISSTPMNTDGQLRMRNPLGKIPCLLDDEQSIFDSRVICRYLDGKHDKAPFHGEGVRQEVLLSIADGIMDAAVSMAYERKLRPVDKQSREWLEGQWKKIDTAIRYVEAEYLRELEVFNIASASLVCALEYLDLRHDERNWRGFVPRLKSWHNGIKDRPSLTSTRPSAG